MRVYLDHNATTPIFPNIKALLPQWAEMSGNPSSVHWGGRGPKTLLRESRQKVAELVGAEPLEVVFTSGGSEANNLAIKGVFFKAQTTKKKRYIVSQVEHPSVLGAMAFIQSLGAQVDHLPIQPDGHIDLDQYSKLLDDDVALVSVMLSNNETGTIFPIKKMAKMAHAAGALFHTDAVQALGKIPLNVKDLDVDFASFAGHKFYALKGVGVLYCRRGISLEPLIHGGGQERHRRAGTENILAIASLGHMAGLKEEIIPRGQEMKALRDHFETRVKQEIHNATVTTESAPRLPNTSSLVIKGVDGETLLMNLDLEGFAVSTGSACSSGSPEPSPVLLAMGLKREQAQNSLRVSFGWDSNLDQVNLFVDTLKQVVGRIRAFQNENPLEAAL